MIFRIFATYIFKYRIMKIVQSSIFRAICSIAVGALLIKYPDNTVTWITVAIGVLFLLSGIISLIAYFNARKHAGEYSITDQEGRPLNGMRPAFPIVGLGSMLLGLILALTPTVFISALMYILGAMLILGAIGQLMSLINARRFGAMPFVFWICPSVILLTGLYVVIKPMETAGLPLLIIGWCSLLYGATEIINTLKIYGARKRLEKRLAQQSQAMPGGGAAEQAQGAAE